MNLATLTCWVYYQMFDIGVSLSLWKTYTFGVYTCLFSFMCDIVDGSENTLYSNLFILLEMFECYDIFKVTYFVD